MELNFETWIESLRSQKYPQTQGTLHNHEGFCCMGVAAVIAGISTPEEIYAEDGEDEGPSHVYEALREKIPQKVYVHAVGMNDGGRSFAEIADMLEKELTPQ